MLLLSANTVPICAEIINVHVRLIAAIRCHLRLPKSCEANIYQPFLSLVVLKKRVARDKKDGIYYALIGLLESV